jgi:hypothetical protein
MCPRRVLWIPLLSEAQPQHLSITLWAWATLLCRHEFFTELIAVALLLSLGKADHQGLATTMWACATLGHVHLSIVIASRP